MNKQITVKQQPKYPRRGTLTKFWLGDETFSRPIFLLNEYFYLTNIIKKSKFPKETDEIFLPSIYECSIQRPNFKMDFNLRGQ